MSIIMAETLNLCKNCVHSKMATSNKDLLTVPIKGETIIFEPIIKRSCLTSGEQAMDDFAGSIELDGGEVTTDSIRSEADWNATCEKPDSFSPKGKK